MLPLHLYFLSWSAFISLGSLSLAENGTSLTVLTPNDCGTCLGHQLLYECTTVGTGTTVWKGSAFQCPDDGNSALLSHRDFSSGTTDTCNRGAIMGQSVRVVNNCYVSRLYVTIDASMNGQTIQCFYNNGLREIEIGSEIITIREAPFLPPHEVNVSSVYLGEDASSGSISFTWNSVQVNCPALHYSLTSINCGTCPDIARSNRATCHNVSVWDVCTFAVSTVACETIMGDASSSVSITAMLKVPPPPTINPIPLYSATNGYLQSITTTFEEIEPFTISRGIDGSATSYTVIYLDSQSGSRCGSETIPVSHCMDGTCRHVFSVKKSNCPPCVDINATVFATNLLGSGALSDMITIGSINEIVDIEFDAILSSIRCVFKLSKESEKHCSIMYGPSHGEQCADLSLTSEIRNSSLDSTSTAVLIKHLHLQNESRFCSIITASDGTTTASIEKVLNAGCNPQQLSDGTLASDSTSCGGTLHTLGIKNGIVCYGSVDVGASAVHSCSTNCGDKSEVVALWVRTCLPNGSWSGTIPKCECGLMPLSSEIPVTILTATSAVFTIAIVILATAIIILARAKYKVQVELKELQSRTNVVYEEIVMPSISIDSKRNVAYDHVTK